MKESNLYFNPNLKVSEKTSNILPSLAGAFVMTFCLIWGMDKLLQTDALIVEPTGFPVPDPVLVPREPPPMTREEAPVKPPEATLPPRLPSLDVEVEPTPHSGGITRPTIEPIAGGDITMYSSNQPIPAVMVQPDYPRRAAQKGIEGYADVVFDVQASGITANVRLLDAQPSGYFERSAVTAVKKWRFNPVHRNGQPVATLGMTHRIVFEMSK